MRRECSRLSLLLALLGGFAPSAHADARLGLAWDDCAPVGAIQKSFACDTNDGGPFELILSVVPPPGIPDFVAFLGVVDFDFESQVTPSWWDFPGCRPSNSLLPTQAPSGLSCPDISEKPFTFGWDYAFGVGYPGRARFRVLGFIPVEDAFPLAPDTAVALCRVSISRQRTVGAASCAGCSTPLCILFSSVLLDTRTIGGGQTVVSGYKNFARFQQTISCPFIGSPATPSTWGAIKSLYR